LRAQSQRAQAKGYPDLATRQFVSSCLQSAGHKIVVFGLFDYDPYGIDILKCYRVGSKASAAEPQLARPGLKWIGLRSEDVATIPRPGAAMLLSQSDRQRAVKLMASTSAAGFGVIQELQDCRDELQCMLMLNKKAEIQVLEHDLCRWAEQKMMRMLSAGEL
jgi:meiotic recombination protein SPO11